MIHVHPDRDCQADPIRTKRAHHDRDDTRLSPLQEQHAIRSPHLQALDNCLSNYSIPCSISSLIHDYASDVFISTWKVPLTGKIVIPGTILGRSTINWGDGCVQRTSRHSHTQYHPVHVYDSSYLETSVTIVITGHVHDFSFNDLTPPQARTLLSISSWGLTVLEGTQGGQFAGCSRLTSLPVDSAYVLHHVTNMSRMFQWSGMITLDLSQWDTSSVTRMDRMFENARSFDGDIRKLDTSSVIRMDRMFAGAISLQADPSQWNTSSVTRMDMMFYKAEKFSGDLSRWKTSKVTSMRKMFFGANVFTSDLSNWDTSSVEDMQGMFQEAYEFNADLSRWETSHVVDMSHMFEAASAFRGDLCLWDTSRVGSMLWMFFGATSFNSDLSQWDTSRVRFMGNMFNGASSFSSDLSQWSLSSVRDVQDTRQLLRGGARANNRYNREDTSWLSSLFSIFKNMV